MRFHQLCLLLSLALATRALASSSPSSSSSNPSTWSNERDNIMPNVQPSWNLMRDFEDSQQQQQPEGRDPLREFEDIQSKFSYLDRTNDNGHGDAAVSATAGMEMLDLKARASKTAAKDQEATGEENKSEENQGSESLAHRNANNANADANSPPLTDRWFPPFWDPERSLSVQGSKNSTSTFSDSQKEKKPNFIGKKSQKDKKLEEEEGEEDQDTKQEESQGDEADETKEDEKSDEADTRNSTKTEKVPPKEKKSRPQKSSSGKANNNNNKSEPEQHRQVIIMGSPMGPGRSMGGGPQMTPQQQYQQQQQMRKTATSLAAAEVLISVLGNSLRLWFLLWASRHVANRQESVVPTQHFVFERLNDKFVRDTQALKTALQQPPRGISNFRWKRIMSRRSRKEPLFSIPKLDQTFVKTAIVVEFGNDSRGNLDLKYLSDIVTFLLSQHRAQAFGSVQGEKENEVKPVDLEIIFKVDSPGGSVAAFGLAAAQVERLRREAGIATTVCVDKFAASGGYMIASQANRLIAAPFATVGSVGVIMETLNFHDILKSYGVQPMVVKAGNAKNPLTTYGPVTKRDLEQEQVRLAKVHEEFQSYTIKGRPQLKGKEDEVCNGSVYIGREALQLNLIDAIMTSEEYLMGQIENGVRVLKVYRSNQSRMPSHVRFPSPVDILPHLKNRIGPLIGSWASDPEILTKVVKAGSILGFVHHLFSNRFGMSP